MNILDILRNAGINPDDPKVAKELGQAARSVRSNVAGAIETERAERIARADSALLALVSGNGAAFTALDAVDTAPDQLQVRAIRQRDGTRCAVARVKVAYRQAPRFVDLLTGDDTDETAWESAKRPHGDRESVGE